MDTRLCRIRVSGVLVAWSSMVTAASIGWAAEGPPPSLVVTAPVVQREVSERRTFVGTVMPMRRSVIGSAVEGRVLDLLVNDGDWIEAGATLAELRKVTIQLEIDAAKADLELRKRELEELRSSLPVEREQAQAALARTRALQEYAKARLARSEALFARGVATSQEELEEIRSKATEAEQAALETAAAYQLKLRPRDEKILQAAAAVAKQEAAVALLEDQLDKFTIVAPFDGYVTAKYTEDGAWIRRGEPVVELVSVDPIEVSVLVPEEFIASIGPGMSASLELDAVPGELMAATISRIVPQADVRSRSFPVKLNVPNPRTDSGHVLKAGMLARVTLSVAEPRQAILVPKDALVLGGPAPIVFVIGDDPRMKQQIASAVPVQLGVADGAEIQVLGNLQPGQQVVVRGNERLMPGAPVIISAAPPSNVPASPPVSPSASSPAASR